MKKRKKEAIQIDLWGNKIPKKNKKLSKFAAFNAERDLVIRMMQEARIRKEKTK